MLFSLYREKQHWSAKDLRLRTEQPEGYLKEVLQEIADLHRSGEFTGLYELKPNFRDSVSICFFHLFCFFFFAEPSGDFILGQV